MERVVDEHPAVFESAAAGVPDEMRDEAIRVFVVPAQGATVTADELLAHCRERLAKFKVPDTIEFVDELPRTSVGKVQEHLLKRRSHDRHPTCTEFCRRCPASCDVVQAGCRHPPLGSVLQALPAG
ncbi:MAG: AMP-binding enzyme [Egibacteraceae bacterium]